MLIPNDEDQQRQVSVEQAEADYHAEVREFLKSETDNRRADALRKPFGFQNQSWEALKAQMRVGDELWEFCTDQASWGDLMGRAGFELRRTGVVIASVIIRLN